MKKAFIVMMLLVLAGCIHSTLFAAELLDVKPIVAGSSVSVEISADIAMTYTYYKIPGQTRVVVDIAEADPEKIEPLIVVNKGLVSSISVDSAQISGIVASRIIFNLISETDIYVTATPDRKKLMVTFGDSAPVASTAGIRPDSTPEIRHEVVAGVVAKTGRPAIAVTAAAEEEGTPGVDDSAAKHVVPSAKATTAATAGAVELSAVSAAARIPKLVPVVPADNEPALPSALTIKEIVAGVLSVEIHTNQPVSEYKIMKLSKPDRLVIDIPCEKTDQRPNATAINKFGISRIRIGVSPRNIRIVVDSSKAGFPSHSITKTVFGLRINFK
ncbi:MAG: AMIN domain-containing protein [Desulfuromonadaceae bacterium]